MSYSHDPFFTIDQIERLTSNHPKPVQKLLSAAEAVELTMLDAPVFDGIEDPKNVEKLILERAQHHAATSSGGVDQLSPFQKAKHEAALAVRHQLVQSVRVNQDHYISQLQQRFDSAAKAYTENIEILPESFDATDVAEFSQEEFAALQTVTRAVQELRNIRSYLRGFPEVSGQLSMDNAVSADLLILNPVDIDEFNRIQYPAQPENRTITRIAPEYREALSAGAEFRLSTVAEAVATYRAFKA